MAAAAAVAVGEIEIWDKMMISPDHDSMTSDRVIISNTMNRFLIFDSNSTCTILLLSMVSYRR